MWAWIFSSPIHLAVTVGAVWLALSIAICKPVGDLMARCSRNMDRGAE